MENKESAKKLFKSVYKEDPSTFKSDFKDIVKERILQKIDSIKKNIVSEINNGYVKEEKTDSKEKMKTCEDCECEYTEDECPECDEKKEK